MKASTARFIACTAMMGALISCGSLNATSPERPAIIVGATSEGRAELQRVLEEANYGAPVTISESAFTDSSQLILEQGRLLNPTQRMLNGRDLGKPRIFHLVSRAEECWLIRAADGQRWRLTNINCVPES
ncbi:hypothetical protein ACNKU7_03580 [Microbulbifer sp. SA54]|uniref:hypothetical protein n=1 Tax=Microbulbifer sp. SA54 TaxID=3401577 RepID=UPI003AB00F49